MQSPKFQIGQNVPVTNGAATNMDLQVLAIIGTQTEDGTSYSYRGRLWQDEPRPSGVVRGMVIAEVTLRESELG
jgi:hypothetical protein